MFEQKFHEHTATHLFAGGPNKIKFRYFQKGCRAPGRSGLTPKCTIWGLTGSLVEVIPNLKNHLTAPYWTVKNR